MSKNAMAGAVTLCGVGLCMIGGAMLIQNGAQAHAAGTMPAAAAAVAATASAQAGGEPTVVWYGVGGSGGSGGFPPVTDRVYRAWSDGTVEMKRILWYPSNDQMCGSIGPCSSPWFIVSSPTVGFRAAADVNADELVDGADLATVLSNWGDAPRVPFPPSDCPLNLVNP